MTIAPAHPDVQTLSDEHSVLLWQTCSYADDLIDAVHTGRPVAHAHDAMLEFAHYRLLPYLTDEERQLPATRLRDDHLSQLLLDDHARIRLGVDNVEGGRTRQLLALAADGLVERLDRHIRREETWVTADATAPSGPDAQNWALPLLLTDEIDIDAIPDEAGARLVLQRLAWMRYGEAIHIESSRDLHPLWLQHHAREPDSHVWVYEQDGPSRWRVRVTRRSEND
jgi:uncharacterized protein (DUF2249 family)